MGFASGPTPAGVGGNSRPCSSDRTKKDGGIRPLFPAVSKLPSWLRYLAARDARERTS